MQGPVNGNDSPEPARIDIPPSAGSTGRLTAWLTVVGVLTFVNYLGRAVAGPPDRDVLYEWPTFVGALIQFGFMLVIVLLIARGGPSRELLALRRPVSWGRAALISVAVYAGVLVVALALEPFVNAEEEQGLVPEEWDPERAAPFVANFLVIVLFVPVVEELTFRGVGFTLLAARLTLPATVLVVGVLFGLAHGLLEGLPVLIAFGLGLAWLRSRTDSVYPCMILHGLFNAVALLVAISFGSG